MPTGSTLSAAIYRQLIVESRLETHQRPYPTPNPGLIEYLAMSGFTTNAGAHAGAGALFLVHTCRFPIEHPSACGAPHRFLKHHLVFLGSASKLSLALPLPTPRSGVHHELLTLPSLPTPCLSHYPRTRCHRLC